MKYPKLFEELIEELKRLPGVGARSAERMAYELLEMDVDKIEKMASTFVKSRMGLKKCSICGIMCENDVCEICQNSLRNGEILCVVASSKDAYAIEKSEEYQGLYHILDGVLSAVNGVGPSDLNIDSLLKRCQLGEIKEIIIATNPNIEGETTALYLAKLLEKFKVVTSRLAYGLSVGGNLDYTDQFTLSKAIQGRRRI